MAKKPIPKCASITQERLRHVLTYDPLTGLFTKNFASGKWPKGFVRGTVGHNGYVDFYFDGAYVLAHRLAWFYMTGAWPTDQIDHEDLNKQNNIWTNLRAATQLENMQNLPIRSGNKTGVMGVSFSVRRGKYVAVIHSNKKQKWLGYFDDVAAASAAYAAAKADMHTFHPSVRIS